MITLLLHYRHVLLLCKLRYYVLYRKVIVRLVILSM